MCWFCHSRRMTWQKLSSLTHVPRVHSPFHPFISSYRIPEYVHLLIMLSIVSFKSMQVSHRRRYNGSQLDENVDFGEYIYLFLSLSLLFFCYISCHVTTADMGANTSIIPPDREFGRRGKPMITTVAAERDLFATAADAYSSMSR